MHALGLDGCKGGWAGAWWDGSVFGWKISSTFAEAMSAREWASVAVDMPIGLLSDRVRRADALARERLRPYRSSSIFATPIRPALEAETYAEGLEIQRSILGKGFSKQAWMLKPKIMEVDAWLRSHPGHPVVETHPEVVFAALSGGPCPHSKKTREGASARLALLKIDELPRLRGAESDDWVDAVLCLKAAVAVLENRAIRFPEPPELDDWGLIAAMTVPVAQHE